MTTKTAANAAVGSDRKRTTTSSGKGSTDMQPSREDESSTIFSPIAEVAET
jgi:hypothetical protein